MQIDTPITATLSAKDTQKVTKALDGVSSRQAIEAKAKEFEEIFIADSLKNAKIGMADSSLVSDTKITDTFSTFMNQALAKVIVSQGGFGLTEHITQSLLQQQSPSNKPKE
jgi:Rod binding domain-containing protein